jgi:hypothetical protein
MTDYILLNRDSTSYPNADREMIRSELEEAIVESDIRKKMDRMADETKFLGFDLRYEWEVGVEDEAYILTEHRYISKKWYYALLSSVFGISICFLISVINSVIKPNQYVWLASEPSFLIYGYDIALLFCLPVLFFFTGVASLTVIGPRPVEEISELNVYSCLWYILLFVLMCISLMGIVGIVFSSLISTLTFLVILMIALGILSTRPNLLLYRDSLSPRSAEEHSSEFGVHNPHTPGSFMDEEIFNLPKKWSEFAPPVLTKSHILVTTNIILMIILSGLAIFGLSFFVPLGLVLVGFNMWSIWHLYSSVSGSTVRNTIRLLKKDNRRQKYATVTVLWTILTIVVSYIALGLPFAIVSFLFEIRPMSIISQPSGDLPASVSLLYIAIPLMYPVIGLCYQTVHSLRSYKQFFWDSTTIKQNLKSEASIRRVEKQSSPFCLSTGFTDYIFIPSEFLNSDFDKKELEAIIAHEEKHIRENEALLFLIIPVLSIILFTGQNVLYGLFNFRQRELQADQYAKEKAGEEAIISALNKMKEKRTERDTTPPSDWQQSYSLFYGTFAHSKAHPSLQYRIDRLRQSK